MKKLKTGIAVMVMLMAGLAVEAQNGINSPYSQFGIGLSDAPYNSPFAMSRGAILARGETNQINIWNPGSYGKITSQSFVFDLGLGVQMSTLRDGNTKQFDADGLVAYLSIGFPLCKWWKTVFSVQPYSDVSYGLTTYSTDTSSYGKMKTLYEGNGGVNRFTWGHGFNIGSRVSLGFNVHLLYGHIERGITYDFEANDTTFYIDSRKQKDTRVLNWGVDFGLNYEQPIGEKYTMTMGLTLKPGWEQGVKENALVYTFAESSGNEYMRDTIFPLSGESGEYRSKLIDNWRVGIGLSLERNERWLVGFDYVWAQWNGMKYQEGLDYHIFGSDMLEYGAYHRIGVGFEWLGDAQGAKYWQRIGYSAGIHYEANKLNMVKEGQEHNIGEIGAGLGVRLPMRKGKSVINVAVGYSHFGESALLQRDCFTIGVSLGSCESWFVKRKYN